MKQHIPLETEIKGIKTQIIIVYKYVFEEFILNFQNKKKLCEWLYYKISLL